jgi:hypothetical protein
VSESQGEGQPEGSGQPSTGSGQPSSSSGQPSNSGPSNNKPSNSGASNNKPSSSGPSTNRPSSGSSTASGQPRTSGNGQPGGGRSPSRPSDPVVDFQRWLMKAGARSMANQVADQVKRTIGSERRDKGDVWDTATNELPPNEAPECQWCPVCQAARAARMGGASGLGAALSGAGTVLGSVVQDAFSAFEQVMKTQEQNRSAERSGAPRPRPSASDTEETGQ